MESRNLDEIVGRFNEIMVNENGNRLIMRASSMT